jgi:hypothetical protein
MYRYVRYYYNHVLLLVDFVSMQCVEVLSTYYLQPSVFTFYRAVAVSTVRVRQAIAAVMVLQLTVHSCCAQCMHRRRTVALILTLRMVM